MTDSNPCPAFGSNGEMTDSNPVSGLRVVTLEEPRDSTKLRLPMIKKLPPAPEPAPAPAPAPADGQQDHGDAEQIVYKSDTLEMIKKLPPAHFDLLYTNPPFGTTGAAWDKALDWDATWPEIWRVLKPNGAVVLHCSMPFTYDLAASQRKWLKYHYTWVKNNSTTFMLAKTQPMRIQEEILVFYKSQPTYNPQMLGGEFHNKRAVKHGGREGYWGNSPDKNQESAEGGRAHRSLPRDCSLL